MKKIILIGGDLAAGKSTFAKLIEEKFNCLGIYKDNLKEILGDTIRVENRQENKKLSIVCFDLIKYIIVHNKGLLLVESNFKPYEMKELQKLLDEYQYEVLTIVLKADDKVLHDRFLKRLNENRHYVHKSQDFTKLEDFQKALSELRSVEYFGDIIHIDATNFSYQNDNNIWLKITDFIEKC